jgi:hypothetical protein
VSGGGIQTTDWFDQNAPAIPKGSSGAPKAPSTAVSSPASPQAIQGGSGDWFAKNAPAQSAPAATAPAPMSKLELLLRAVDPTGLGQMGLVHKEIGDWLTDKAEKNRSENLAAEAAGKPKPHSEAVTSFLGGLADLAEMGASSTSPTNMAIAGGVALANTNPVTGIPVDAAIVAHGGLGVAKNAPAAIAGNPEAAQNALLSAAEMAGGGAGAAQQISAVRNFVPLGKTMTTPRGTTPPTDYTPEEVKAYADANGIKLSAAQATGHNLPQALQTAGERAAVGGTAVKTQIADSQAALTTHAETLMDRFSPTTPDTASIGKALQSGVQKALDTQLTKADANYAKVDATAQGTTVDLKPVKAMADRILADTDILQKASLDPKTATRVLKGLENLEDDASFSDAQKLRSALLDLSRSPELAISTTAQGMLKQVIGATDQAMMDAAQGTPELQKAFRSANAHYEQIQEDMNSPRSPLNQILSEPDPSKVPQKLTAKGQTGGSPYNAQLLDTYSIDKGPLKRVILGDMLNKNFGLYGKSLAGYSDEFLRSVFTPDELDAIYKTGVIGRSLGLNVNPSGTAGATSAIEQTGNPLKAAKQTAAAKFTASPHFNNWLMRVTGAAPSTAGGRAAAVTAGAQQDREQ